MFVTQKILYAKRRPRRPHVRSPILRVYFVHARVVYYSDAVKAFGVVVYLLCVVKVVVVALVRKISEASLGKVFGKMRRASSLRRGVSRSSRTAIRVLTISGFARGFGLLHRGDLVVLRKHDARRRDEPLDDVARQVDLLWRPAHVQLPVRRSAFAICCVCDDRFVEFDFRAADLARNVNVAATLAQDASDVVVWNFHRQHVRRRLRRRRQQLTLLNIVVGNLRHAIHHFGLLPCRIGADFCRVRRRRRRRRSGRHPLRRLVPHVPAQTPAHDTNRARTRIRRPLSNLK